MKNILILLVIIFTINGFSQHVNGRLSWSDDIPPVGGNSQKNFHLPSTTKYVPAGFVTCSGPHLISINADYSILKNGRSIKWVINNSNFEDNNTLYYNYNGSKTIPLSDFGMGSRVSIGVRANLLLSANGKSHEITLYLNNGSQQEIREYCNLLEICDQLGSIDVKIIRIEYTLKNLSEIVNAFKPYFMQNIYEAPSQQETEQPQDNNTNQTNNNNSNNSNNQTQYGENNVNNISYTNQNTNSSQNQTTSNYYQTPEEYNENQKRLNDEKYQAEKKRLYNDAQNEIELINVQYEQRQKLLDEGLEVFAQGIASGDRYERTGAVMTGAAKVFSSMGLDPEIAFGGALLVGALSALIKTEEEREAERLAAENERLFNEFQTIVKIADKKLLFAEQQDEYNYALYKESKDEYEKIVNNKFAGGYPSGMIYKIENLMETERIKDLMIDFSNEFNTEANNKYLLETTDKIYFYFATIQIDPKNRVSYLKTSNIFPVHYNNATLSWPFYPEIKNKIYSKQKTAIIKGYFKTKYDAEESKNNYIKLAKNNYYQVEDEYYSISFNQSDFKYNPYVKTDFWGNDKKSSSNKDNTDFWGNTSSKKTGNTTTEKDSTSEAEFKTDFWGNPVSTKKDTSLKINNKPKEMKQSGELDFWGNPIKNEP